MDLNGFDSSLTSKQLEQDDEIRRLLLNDEGEIRNLSDVYYTVTGTETHKRLDSIGHHLQRVRDYANKYNIDDDPISVSIMRISGCAQYIGVAACIQLEFGLHLSEVYNIEYEYAINVRSYLECVARVHKGTRLLKTFINNEDVKALDKGTSRLIAKHEIDPFADNITKIYQAYKKNRNKDELIEQCDRLILSQEEAEQNIRGYGITTLVDSLKDKIPDIDNKYGELSEYLHGDFYKHYISRRLTHFQGLKIQQSPVILKFKPLLDSLRDVLADDLEFMQKVTMGFKKKMDPDDPPVASPEES